MGTRGALQCVPVAQGDGSATAFPLSLCKHWVGMCLVPGGGTIFPPLRSDPAVSPWAEMSQLYIVTACPWVGLQLSWGRFQRVNACSFRKWMEWGLLTPEVVQDSEEDRLKLAEMPPLVVILCGSWFASWLLLLSLDVQGREACLGFDKGRIVFLCRDSLVSYEESQTGLRLAMDGSCEKEAYSEHHHSWAKLVA